MTKEREKWKDETIIMQLRLLLPEKSGEKLGNFGTNGRREDRGFNGAGKERIP